MEVLIAVDYTWFSFVDMHISALYRFRELAKYTTKALESHLECTSVNDRYEKHSIANDMNVLRFIMFEINTQKIIDQGRM